jgi:hypothetical protein
MLIVSAITGKAVTYSYSDTDLFAHLISRTNPKYSGTFDITSDGYDKDTQTILNAKVGFALSDDQLLDTDEWVTFELNGEDFLSPIEVDLTLVGGQVIGQALVTLDQTGTLSYSILWDRYRNTRYSDFWALGAKLVAEAGPRAVPDGGATLMLLGGALAGIEVLRRRAAKKLKRQPAN